MEFEVWLGNRCVIFRKVWATVMCYQVFWLSGYLNSCSLCFWYKADWSKLTFTCTNCAKSQPLQMIRVSFFGLTWSLLLGGKAFRPDGRGGSREGQIFTKPHSWSEGSLKHLQLQLSVTWLTVKWVTVNRGGRMSKRRGRKRQGRWMCHIGVTSHHVEGGKLTERNGGTAWGWKKTQKGKQELN